MKPHYKLTTEGQVIAVPAIPAMPTIKRPGRRVGAEVDAAVRYTIRLMSIGLVQDIPPARQAAILDLVREHLSQREANT